MKTQFIGNCFVREDGIVTLSKGYQLDQSEALFAIRQLEHNYTKEAGWRLTHWVQKQRGKVLVDFEMEAERDMYGKDEHVRFSIARNEEPVRRYR